MTSTAQPTSRRPAGCGFLLLMLAVLAGLLGMHALGPTGGLPTRAHSGHGVVMTHAADTFVVSENCTPGSGGAVHLTHADGTCAAPGVASSYSPPALAAALIDTPAASTLSDGMPEPSASTRAPPDLSELQLLRI
ncbi:hypothetical protein STXM2123_739 [Streptomyces sp. F-3]|jgi:hypothetical protein|uniref:DUF6153 family protein n=1 Tax=Streptomyces thermogriseus TaxID=75292 RepID=A0ABN1T2N0_9ACTN|nr:MULTISPECIES: DUF6153 family protein [Streptomyces]MDN5381875.1 DUF6153 family protein [Streptomyces sp. LB8]GAT80038.1 hypothetical protein STXM2123_739 [Streptomyces sp. F-3]